MSDNFINILLGILIGFFIGASLTTFKIAYTLSKKITREETEKTYIYTIKWEDLKEEYK